MGTHIDGPLRIGRLKTTIEISDPLLRAARKLAASERTTLRNLVERGLRRVLDEQPRAATFKLRRASFKGKGLRQEIKEASWDRLRELAYHGRGG
jgi:hypothetical protein